MKTKETPQAVFLKDYKFPDFLTDTVDMRFDLHEEFAAIQTRSSVHRNPKANARAEKMVLCGEEMKLEKLIVDGKELKSDQYELTEESLSFTAPTSNAFSLEIWTRTKPHKNLAFDGLFKSGGNFLTQCEPEGFRRMTYFLDRPDVMAKYSVTIEADKTKYPVLLSNGNRIETKDLAGGRHMARWQDPFPKPSYLFALVAGDFGVLRDTLTTKSGRPVKLEVYCKKGHEDRCQWAMTSLKQAMKWDEDVYGLEYDLDIYMIVATDDFNMGAMENKGLNIFNSTYVLAKPETATDHDYHGIQAVVGHEYFHNWTGNRVTCRDWFQLSLKEGLTVFRDQEFSSDMTSRAVRRIEEVTKLRTEQFAEDAGPMAHPVRPASYIEINNFYTRTIYEKGAEVIRMIHTIIGAENFRKGMDKYFELFDGQAVRTEDFVHAMETASGVDLTQFKTWYHQSGTPTLRALSEFDASAKTFTLTLEQTCLPTPGENEKKPMHIPVAVGLLGPDGRDLNLDLATEDAALASKSVKTPDGSITRVLHLKQAKQTFVFKNIQSRPVLSILRGFSAPVRLDYENPDGDLSFQIANDADAFCRWEAAQELAVRAIQALVGEAAGMKNPGTSAATLVSEYANAMGSVIKDAEVDLALKALIMRPPSEPYLSQFFSVVRPQLIHEAREKLLSLVASTHKAAIQAIHADLEKRSSNENSAKAAGERALKNVCLFLLAKAGVDSYPLALEKLKAAKNMTDELGALAALNSTDSKERETAMGLFHTKWKDESLVMNKWLELQALSTNKETLTRIKNISQTADFDETNPNKVANLYVRFATQNLVQFHESSGEGYKFIADRVIAIDERNPQLAARIVSAFNSWKRYEPELQAKMKTQLERIVAKSGLSKNTFEIVSKALA